MKFKLPLFVFFLQLLFGLPSIAQTKQSELPFCSLIQTTQATKGLYQASTPPSLMQKSDSQLNDLRLYDSKKNNTPFVRVRHQYQQEWHSYQTQIQNYQDNLNTQTLLFSFEDKNLRTTPPLVSELEIPTPEVNFAKAAKLWGKQSIQAPWQLLKSDSIYDYSQWVKLRKTKLKFAPVNYPFYKLVLSGTSPKEVLTLQLENHQFQIEMKPLYKKKLSLKTLKLHHHITPKPAEKWSQIQFENLKLTPTGDDALSLDLKVGLPAHKVIFDIDNPMYKRQIKVYRSQNGTDYHLLKKGEIHRIDLPQLKSNNNTLTLKSPYAAYYRFEFNQIKNNPIALKSIRFEWHQEDILWMGAPQENYQLCIGKPKLTHPPSELESFISQSNWKKQKRTVFSAQPALENPGYSPPSFLEGTEWTQLILYTVMAVVVLILVIWLALLLKEEPDSSEK